MLQEGAFHSRYDSNLDDPAVNQDRFFDQEKISAELKNEWTTIIFL